MGTTYIDGEVEEVEGAWIGGIVVVGSLCHLDRDCTRFDLNRESATGQHGHEDIRDMHQDGTKDLFRSIESPDLERALRPLPPALKDQREQRQCSQRALHNQGKGAQQLALALRLFVYRG